MSDTGSTALRELARSYYTGELDYVAYRNQRTRLLDGLTQQAVDADTSTERTRPIPDEPRRMRESTSRRKRLIWILMIILIMVAALIWVMKSGWIAISPAKMESGATATSVTVPEINRQ